MWRRDREAALPRKQGNRSLVSNQYLSRDRSVLQPEMQQVKAGDQSGGIGFYFIAAGSQFSAVKSFQCRTFQVCERHFATCVLISTVLQHALPRKTVELPVPTMTIDAAGVPFRLLRLSGFR